MHIADELRKIFPEDQVTENPTILEQHSHDESHHTPHLPDVVVFPKRMEEVVQLMTFANKHRIPVVPYGIGSSVEGNPIPSQGGISIDFQQMNKIVEVRPHDLLVRVQPGVTRTQLNKALKKYGLFFSVDPGADATLGGMAATNASGTTSVRYGVMRDQVLDLEVVLADGRVIHTGGLSVKSSSGYHLTGLFVGSEGTLGVFTELTLKVYGIPEEIQPVRATFPTIEQAVNAAVSLLTAGIPMARMELVDDASIAQVNRYSQTDYMVKPTLFLEFHGNKAGVQQDLSFAREIAKAEGCYDFQFETDSKAQTQLWEARHNLAFAFIHGYPGKKMMVTDVCVPISELPGAILHARGLLDDSGLGGAIVGHVGDGNFHALVMIDPNDAHEKERADDFNQQIVQYALSRGGTCTGEHGVGLGKKAYQQQEHGEALPVMQALKQTLDPKGILNPGKIFEI